MRMKISVSVPDDLFKHAERATKQLGISRSRFYQQALMEYLEKRSDRAVTEALNAAYGSVPREGLIDPLLAQIQSESISRNMR